MIELEKRSSSLVIIIIVVELDIMWYNLDKQRVIFSKLNAY